MSNAVHRHGLPGGHGLPGALRKVLDRYRRRWRWVTTLKGLLLTVAVLAAGVGAGVGADRLLRLAPSARAVLLVAIAAVGLFCLVRLVLWLVLRRVRDRDAAIRLGRRFPKEEEDLVTGVELSNGRGSEEGISASMVASALDKIAQRTRAVDPRAAVPLRPLGFAAVAFAAVAAVLAAAYVLRPEAVSNGLLRLLRPDRPVPYFCYTQLAVEPGDCVVAVGKTAEVAIRTSGWPAERARLELQTGQDTTSVVLPCSDGAARWLSGPLFDDLLYRVHAGDAVSPWHRVHVVPPPSVGRWSAVVRDPDYAGGQDRTVDRVSGSLEVVDGATVTLRAEPVARGTAPEFRCEGVLLIDKARRPLKPDAQGLLCSAPFVARKSTECSVELSDGFGLRNGSAETLFVKVVPDELPRVNIVRPGGDLLVLPDETVPVEIVAEDDFGLRKLTLRYRTVQADTRAAGRWLRETVREGGQRARRLEATKDLKIAELELKPGDRLEYMAEAADYAGDPFDRNVQTSVYRITVLSEAKHLELALGRLEAIQMELLRRAAEQNEQAREAAALADKAKADKVNEPAESAKERQTAYARATQAIAEKVENILPELARNRTTPPQVFSELEALARAVRSTAKGPMTAAAENFAKASAGSPGEQQAAELNQAGQKCEEAARQLERLAQLAAQSRRPSRLENLAAQAERLAARQNQVRTGSTLPLALKTAGLKPDSLNDEQKRALDRLMKDQRTVGDDARALAESLGKAASSMADQSPGDAAAASEAAAKFESEKLKDNLADVLRSMEENVLFTPLEKQEQIAASLSKIADMLRRPGSSASMASVPREIQRFIERQKGINLAIETAIRNEAGALKPVPIGEKQVLLGRDVSEQATALERLAQEIEGFESFAVARLEAASGEMRAGADNLYRASLPAGLEHGKKALALLEEAGSQFEKERDQMDQASQAASTLEAALRLQRLLADQKKINAGTGDADQVRTKEPDAFRQQTTGLARNQGAARIEADQLRQMLARFRAAAETMSRAGDKMDVSRLALDAGDTGTETRTVQRQIVILLEQLLGEQKQRMASMGLAGARMLAMMQMMAQPGMSPGGYAGGSNAFVLPAALGDVRDPDWRKTRSRFEETLAAGFDGDYSPEFRALLTAYFDRLRKEPRR